MMPTARQWAVAMLIAFLQCVSWLLYSQSSPIVNTVFSIMQQDHCPMKILQVSHTTSDYLTQAKIRNQTLKNVESYRVGWVMRFSTGKAKVGVGKVIRIKDALKPGEVVNVPAQR